ncbi:RNA-directed DNA polymerase from mobile element jockey [Eumeta japonica]|uniref:RNA-directed DNA polymerase from mobile element jockey n=1 Tax=Eumeta variegata TaxID=151549 RepID=A0A4C1ZD46_EUMVA|nr:RNA-directed DNA polymerase from mobile element jockey [Eumeta japonica]
MFPLPIIQQRSSKLLCTALVGKRHESHVTNECKRTKDSDAIPECMNCNGEGHSANYKGCPKAPTFPKIQLVTTTDFRKARSGENRLMVILRYQDLLNRLQKNVMSNEPGCDAVILETFLTPNRPRACKLANYIQKRNDRLGAPRGGTAVYYKRKLYCCPINTPPLINLETSACRLAMTEHGTLIILSVYLPPKKRLLWSDIETLLALGDAFILFDNLNKNTDWCSNITNANGRTLATLVEDRELAIIAPLTPTHLPVNVHNRLKILDLAVLKGVVLNLNSIELLLTILIEEITLNHKVNWVVAKMLKSDVCVAIPALNKPDNNLVFDEQEKVADCIEFQCSPNPASLNLEHVYCVENEVLRRSLLPPKDDRSTFDLGRRAPKTH